MCNCRMGVTSCVVLLYFQRIQVLSFSNKNKKGAYMIVAFQAFSGYHYNTHSKHILKQGNITKNTTLTDQHMTTLVCRRSF